MKRLLLFFVFLSSFAYADTVTKGSDTTVIVSKEKTEEISLKRLKEKKARLGIDRDNLQIQLSRINALIDEVAVMIQQAKDLGVVEEKAVVVEVVR